MGKDRDRAISGARPSVPLLGVPSFHSVGNCLGGNGALTISLRPRQVARSDVILGVVVLDPHPGQENRTFEPVGLYLSSWPQFLWHKTT
jgi:hypothetical protein